MPEPSAEAIRAAKKAIAECPAKPVHVTWDTYRAAVALAALEAAMPHITAPERAKVQHAIDRVAQTAAAAQAKAVAVAVAAERERILGIARELGVVIPADEDSRARWASFADYIETTEPAPEGTP